jgi:hypothetical protein
MTIYVPVKQTLGSESVLMEPQIHYKIIHHIPGRIRLAIPQLASNDLDCQLLEDELLSLHFVDRVTINLKARSLLINYADHPEFEESLRMVIARVLPPLQSAGSKSSSWFDQEIKLFIEDNNMQELLPAIGTASLFLGALGVVLPLVPGTPFLLLSSFCFSYAQDRKD